jgi:hypothetical protein
MFIRFTVIIIQKKNMSQKRSKHESPLMLAIIIRAQMLVEHVSQFRHVFLNDPQQALTGTWSRGTRGTDKKQRSVSLQEDRDKFLVDYASVLCYHKLRPKGAREIMESLRRTRLNLDDLFSSLEGDIVMLSMGLFQCVRCDLLRRSDGVFVEHLLFPHMSIQEAMTFLYGELLERCCHGDKKEQSPNAYIDNKLMERLMSYLSLPPEKWLIPKVQNLGFTELKEIVKETFRGYLARWDASHGLVTLPKVRKCIELFV